MRKKLLIAMPALSRGGGERVVSELSRVFAEHMEVVIAVFERKDSYDYQGRIVDMDVPLRENIFARVFLFFKRLKRLRALIGYEKPDHVMTLGLLVNLMAILVVHNPIVRIDMFISVARKGILGGAVKVLAKLLLRRAGMVIPVSRAIALDLEGHYGVPPEKIQVIYNPTDVDGIGQRAQQPLSPEQERFFQKPVVITMGRLTEQKGQWHLLRAFRAVKSKVPEAQLLLLGEGELREKLEQLAHELGIGDSVHFLGWQQNPFAYASKAQLFVLPSLWEGLPDVLLEAMACKLPIISTDCRSGPREILAPQTDPLFETKNQEQGEYGMLLPVCDGKWKGAKEALAPEELMMADALAGLLKNEQARLRLAEKAAQRARAFDIITIAPQWSFLWE